MCDRDDNVVDDNFLGDFLLEVPKSERQKQEIESDDL